MDWLLTGTTVAGITLLLVAFCQVVALLLVDRLIPRGRQNKWGQPPRWERRRMLDWCVPYWCIYKSLPRMPRPMYGEKDASRLRSALARPHPWYPWTVER